MLFRVLRMHTLLLLAAILELAPGCLAIARSTDEAYTLDVLEGELSVMTKGCHHSSAEGSAEGIDHHLAGEHGNSSAMHHDNHEHKMTFTYSLFTTDGEVDLHLQFQQGQDPDLESLSSGIIVRVTGERQGHEFNVYALELLQENLEGPARERKLASRITDRVTSITYILSICGQPASSDVQTHERLYRKGPSSMEAYMSDCSYGKVKFLPEDNLVIGPIEIPCQGETRHGAFDSRRCGNEEIYGWAQFAEDEATEENPDIDLGAYTRRILILPQMSACRWGGLATFGCGRRCIAWVNGNHATRTSTIFHELGHTFGLMHSGTPGQEYGDCSCAMSNCGGQRCYNAPYSWNLGWVKPVHDLDVSDLEAGIWEKYFLPATQTSSDIAYNQNFLRITSPDLSQTQSLFVSYRKRANGDKGLRFSWSEEVHIHSYSAKQEQSSKEPTLRGRLITNQQWDSSELRDPLQMVIRFDGRRGSFAAVRLCRYSNSSSECDPEISRVRDNSPACHNDSSAEEIEEEDEGGNEAAAEDLVSWAGEEGWIESCEADYSFTGSGDDQSGGNGRTGNAGTLVNPLNNMFLGPLLLALAMLLSSEAIGGLA